MNRTRLFAVFCLIALTSGAEGQAPPSAIGSIPFQPAATMAFWSGVSDAASFDRAMNARLTRARETLDRLLAVRGPRTIENTLQPYDDVLLEIDAVGSQAGLI